jgi:hypothetical protein
MTVKSLIKKLQKMDQNIPVVSWSCEIGKDDPLFGFSEYSKMRIIHLKKAKNTLDGPSYVETEKSKKSIKALYLFSMPGTKIGIFKKNKIG